MAPVRAGAVPAASSPPAVSGRGSGGLVSTPWAWPSRPGSRAGPEPAAVWASEVPSWPWPVRPPWVFRSERVVGRPASEPRTGARPRARPAPVGGHPPPRFRRSWGEAPRSARRGKASSPTGSKEGDGWRDPLSLLGEHGCFRSSGRSPGSRAGRFDRLAAFPFPGGEQWHAGKGSHLQWRDRTGFQPVSLLSLKGPEDRAAERPPVGTEH